MTDKKERAFELDLIRGLAMIAMLFMHMSWDIRYEFGVDVFSYLEKGWFWAFLHPMIITGFVGVSGVCTAFSRNNFKRGMKLVAVAAGFTLGTWLVTEFLHIYCLIIFNVLAVLGISILIYALIEFIEKKLSLDPKAVTVVIALVGAYIMLVGTDLDNMDYATENLLFLPIGFAIRGMPVMADYMPLIPHVGLFLLGSVIGRICYKDKKSAFKGRGVIAKNIMHPVEFIGRHSLIIYLVHQPLIYGILYVIFLLPLQGIR
ncbi:MAG: DUF1624 domain-containing protein [Saccharofermentans sp.]|nr:DUF1624 domain-containing protein [Saccharofermentans sp.]